MMIGRSSAERSVDIRKHEVKDYEVWEVVLGRTQRLLAIVRNVDVVTLIREAATDEVRNVMFILHHEHPCHIAILA
jgi:hypothetical protein